MVLLFALACPGASSAGERKAMGVIVKLKDSAQPDGVLALQGPASSPRGRELLRRVTQRAGVPAGYRSQQTVFSAHVLRDSKPVPYAVAEAQARRLRKDPSVAWAIVNEIEIPTAATSIPSDPGYVRQTWLADSATGAAPNIPAAWDRLAALGMSLSPVIVAVLDTGVLKHPDLAGKVLYDQGYDFVSELEYSNDGDGIDADATDSGSYLTTVMRDSNKVIYGECGVASSTWHGTVIAGQLVSVANNNLGVAGMLLPMTHTPVLPVRVSGSCGAAVSDIIEGLLWAAGVTYTGIPRANAYPARVLNLSFGSAESCGCVIQDGAPMSTGCLYQEAIRAITRRGAVVVAATGNAEDGNPDGNASPARPASCPGVLGVTALRSDGAKARYAYQVGSSGVATMGGSGDSFDDGIYSTSNEGKEQPVMGGNGQSADHYASLDGTSFAAPIVSGAVALMWGVNPGLTVTEVLAGIRQHGVRPHLQINDGDTALPVCAALVRGVCNCNTFTCGTGILDVDRAVAWALEQPVKTFTAPVVNADFFTPERTQIRAPLQSSVGGGSVGRGSLGIGELLWMGAACLFAVKQRRKWTSHLSQGN